MSNTKFTIGDDNQTLFMERTFSASQSKVWEAYSTPELLAKWWGPLGWETTVLSFDFSEGGEWIYMMECVDKDQGDFYGQKSSGKFIYGEINPKDSFEYTDYFTDEDGNIMEEMPESKSKIMFSENADGHTIMKCEVRYATAEALQQVIEMGMKEGIDMTFDRLEELVG